eukprot:COSAG03_NODE_27615_length_252_cov_0.673203_1_plen_51_part_01
MHCASFANGVCLPRCQQRRPFCRGRVAKGAHRTSGGMERSEVRPQVDQTER